MLHFTTPLAHARHYVGATRHIAKRLAAHARGTGSRIMRVVKERRIGWKLATLFECTSRFDAERLVKMQHHAHRYCGECTDGEPQAPDDSLQIPTIPFIVE